jgi:excisionase family DNA binding protein
VHANGGLHDEREQTVADLNDYLTLQAAAALLGISRQRVDQLVREGKLPGVRPGNEWLTTRTAVEARMRTMAGARKGK